MNQVNRVITFYSYKGGVGRSMALANVGVILAQWGYKTLIIDWDLEAPGLENYYKDYLDVNETIKKNGLIDLLNLKVDRPSVEVNAIDWQNYVTPININKNSNLHLITAGKRDENYTNNIRKFDFTSFYSEAGGGQYLEDLREQWLDDYNFVLIDSRTGLTDSSGICSIHMPDILVLFFTPNAQSFNGIKNVSQKAIAGQKQIIFDRFRLRTLPIPCRIENAETILLDEWMQRIFTESEEMLEWLPKKQENLKEYIITPSQLINQLKIPYKTLYAYGERIAAIERGTTDPQDLGYVYETIAGVIANDLQNVHLLINSRDDLIKKAKGEEIIDHSELQRKITSVIEDKSKLEEKLVRKGKQQKWIAIVSALVGVLVIAGFYLFSKSGKMSPTTGAPIDSVFVDSLSGAKAVSDFATRYSTSDQQYDLNFNLEMIRQYYTLDKSYRDSLGNIKDLIEKTVSYKFINLVDSFYLALRNSPKDVQSYLADTVEVGKWRNVQKQVIQKKINDFTRQNKITNQPVASGMSVKSDSAGFKVSYVEEGNFLVDGSQLYKSVRNYDTITFDKNLKIKSLIYTSDVVVSKLNIEIFFCSTNDSKTFSQGSAIVTRLKTNKDWNVMPRNNFSSSSDPSSPYYITSSQIRYSGSNEKKIAYTIKSMINKAAPDISIEPAEARTKTSNYISVFICQQQREIEENNYQKPTKRVNPVRKS